MSAPSEISNLGDARTQHSTIEDSLQEQHEREQYEMDQANRRAEATDRMLQLPSELQFMTRIAALTPTEDVVKFSNAQKVPWQLQVDPYSRLALARAYYGNTIFEWPWHPDNEGDLRILLPRWLESLPPGHVAMINHIRLNLMWDHDALWTTRGELDRRLEHAYYALQKAQFFCQDELPLVLLDKVNLFTLNIPAVADLAEKRLVECWYKETDVMEMRGLETCDPALMGEVDDEDEDMDEDVDGSGEMSAGQQGDANEITEWNLDWLFATYYDKGLNGGEEGVFDYTPRTRDASTQTP